MVIRREDEARALEQHIAGVENATNIAELGIGLNPKSRLTGEITEVKKRLGTVHMALGDSAAGYGGAVTSDVHLDGMILNPRVEIDGEVIVEVVDDGCGIEPARLRDPPAGHLGLTGMRERATLLGGEFTVESAPGQGTRVVTRIPVEGATRG